MAPVMTNAAFHIAAHDDPSSEEADWSRLYARIREIALARAAALAAQDAEADDAFDRGARALRTLMGAADIARRMKDQDAKEKELNARQAPLAVSDNRIREIKAGVERQVERIAREDRAARSGGNGQ